MHSCVFTQGKAIVFGGHASNAERCNDVWEFTPSNEKWRCKKSTKTKAEYNKLKTKAYGKPEVDLGNVCAKENYFSNFNIDADPASSKGSFDADPNAPCPRGGHTAVLYGDKMLVFGGFGGHGFERKDLNDLFAYDVNQGTWKAIETSGESPDPRSEHVAATLGDTMVIYGGCSSRTSFSDVWSLDCQSYTWSKVNLNDSKMQAAKWQVAATTAFALPQPKLFMFGGNSQLEDGNLSEKMTNDLLYFDLGTKEARKIPCHGKPPKKRSKSALAHFPAEHSLIVFGGFNKTWKNDLYTVNVDSIVGPPYAVLSVEPDCGPVTGGTTLRLKGQGFSGLNTVTVRFINPANPQKYRDTGGKVISDDCVETESPPFNFAPTATIQVAAQEQLFTITSANFQFFEVTDAAATIAFGPGISGPCSCSDTTSFKIQAVDRFDMPRTIGGDEFSITACKSGSKENIEIHPEITDNNDGTYDVSYFISETGAYSISVQFSGTYNGKKGHIQGSPFNVDFDSSLEPDHNRINSTWALAEAKKESEASHYLSKHTLDGLQRQINPRDLDDVITIKTHLTNVSNKASLQRMRFAKTQAICRFLRNDVDVRVKDVEKIEQQKKEAERQWDDCSKQAPITKIAIAPIVKSHLSETKKTIEAFEVKTSQLFRKFLSSSLWDYKTNESELGEVQKQESDEHDLLRKQLERMQHLASTFEIQGVLQQARSQTEQMSQELQTAEKLWNLSTSVDAFVESCYAATWKDLKAEEIEDQTKRLLKQLTSLGQDRMRETSLFHGISAKLKQLLYTCPLIQSLKHPSMRQRHWEALMHATKTKFVTPFENEDLLLRDVAQLDLHQHTEQVDDITDQALKEAKMEESLAKLKETWRDIIFTFEDHETSDGGKVQLIKLAEEEYELLENDQLTVQSMSSSRFVNTFYEDIHYWKNSLGNVSEVLSIFVDVQRTWSYLEPLFIGSEEVKKELPEDAERFVTINKGVLEALQEASKKQNVLELCNVESLLSKLESIWADLELCQKSLNDFLAQKRVQFPRFFFVSNTDLLDILSNGSHPPKIMGHVSKVFLAVDTFNLKETQGKSFSVEGWTSCVGVEDVLLEKPLPLKGKVENYFQDILDAQRESLRVKCDHSLNRFPSQSRIDWIMQTRDKSETPLDPSQIMLLVAGTFYVREVEESFKKLECGDSEAMKHEVAHIKENLADLIRLTRKPLQKNVRQRIMNLITMDAHSRDVVERLIAEGVETAAAFQWQSQLKQAYVDKTAMIKVADASFNYGFEYLGNGPRLVITPLTDRIYVTATQALNLCMGCSPAGPAGTGKTETTKDLASATGVVCYVFNCSPEMDYRTLGNIFKGLAASGAWGCFDEFNRLVPAVLSVCSVQFKAVCDGIRRNEDKVVIDGESVVLKHSAGVFITMNPGYLGRSELPEGLKALFRPITVMVPDLVLICENMLMAEGFEDAKILASKFYGLYSLLSELLSKQAHYDWGLRAVKSVLVVAGGFKRAEPDLPEQHLLMRALRDFNTPKIVQQDEAIFFGLLKDLFPGVDPPRKTDEGLEEAVHKACQSLVLDPEDSFCLKVLQLEELLEIRHCVFVMGDPAAGKSSCWKTLAKANQIMGVKTKYVDLNPKAVSPSELYGFVHPATREWKDGLLSKIMRSLGQEQNTNPKWIVLDGDLDTNWIESMNSVMDDNKMLTLASNERIPLKGHMRMLFEIRDLNYASPATVSRAGILYISTAAGSQWRSLIRAWLKQLPLVSKYASAAVPLLEKMFSAYCKEAITWLQKHVHAIVTTNPVAYITTLLRLLGIIMNEDLIVRLFGDESELNDAQAEQHLEMYFVFCCIWAFGGPLSEVDGVDYRTRLSEFWKSTFKSVRMPTRETIFDYHLNSEEMTFEKWEDSQHFTTIDFDSKLQSVTEVTVPTAETVAIQYWLSSLVSREFPIMLAGGSGCGKTQLVNSLLGSQDPEVRSSVTINFNFFTNASILQNMMEANLEKKTGTNYGPIGQSKLVFFIDDVNLPRVDEYNTQSAIALVRQHIDYGHWYDKGKLLMHTVSNCQYVAGMNPSAGSFQINPRLQRHFVTFAVGFPGPSSLYTIYNTFLIGHLKYFSEECQQMASNLLGAALQLHSAVSTTFRKSAKNFHYEFNIRHLSSIFQGILMAQPQELNDPAKLAMLWLHESERVYADRLVSGSDVERFKVLAQNQIKKKLSQYNNVLANFFGTENPQPLIFSHFAKSLSEKKYDQVQNIEKLRQTLQGALDEYNETNITMDLVLFDDAVKHVCRISRIISNRGGHALLVGVGGSGKQSLSRLAAHICDFKLIQIAISSNYSVNDFNEDLRSTLRLAATKDEGVVFLLSESQISNERFLVSVNDLLASGEIPGLFDAETTDEIISEITPRAKIAGLKQLDRHSVWDFFLDQVKEKLHLVLCFSPVSSDFRTRATRFPALVTCTAIDWFQPWPRSALYSVGKKYISSIEGIQSEATREGVAKFMQYSFDSVNELASEFLIQERRHVYTTPKSFLELLKLFGGLLQRKQNDVDSLISRLENGLLKLKETSESVEQIEADLKVSLEAAEEKKTTAEGIAEDVKKNKANVETETEKANKIATEADTIAKSAAKTQAEADEALAEAEPAVQQAEAALDSLNEKELGECRGMQKPPTGVDDVFCAVQCLLAGVNQGIPITKAGKVKPKDKTWESVKKQLLGKTKDFLHELLGFKAKIEADLIPEVNWSEIRPFLSLEHFTPETIELKNKSAAGLCSWVINIVKFRDIYVNVEPLRLKLEKANSDFAEAQAQLQEANKRVEELTAELNELTKKFKQAEQAKAEAIATVTRGQRKLDLANRLTTALADENVRWGEGVTKLREERNLLVGDVLLASAFISYAGPFTKFFRDRLINKYWVKFLKDNSSDSIPMSESAAPLEILTNEAQIALWNSQELPDDQVSVENGAIVTNTDRWALLIDPQLQGIRWIKKKEEELVVLRLDTKHMLRYVEHAVEHGQVLLIENMGERIDPVLNPVIQRATIKRGSRRYLKIGDKELEFHPSFTLILHTKLSNPHYPPEVQAETTLVNFTVTQAGLEDQLLALTVQKERSDLANQKTELIKQQNDFKIKIKELEDNILQRLADAEGEIAEDVELIESMENTKRIAVDIEKKRAIAQETTANINSTSELYRPVAHRAAVLFFLINSLFKVHTYYIYSLESFVRVCESSILKTQRSLDAESHEHAEVDDDEEQEHSKEKDEEATEGSPKASGAAKFSVEETKIRCTSLVEGVTKSTFDFVELGLFEKNKLMFSAQLCLTILQDAGKLDPSEVRTLLIEDKDAAAPVPMDLSEWMTSSIWNRLKGIAHNIKSCEKLCDEMVADAAKWQTWFDHEKPETKHFPGAFKKVSSFNKVLIIRAMRPDRVSSAMAMFVEEQIGSYYVSSKALNMQKVYNESGPSIPIFFVLFPGVDPTLWVEQLGEKLGVSSSEGNFVNISMGQGQDERALKSLKECGEKGGWLMLQNVHLMQEWLPILERELEQVAAGAHERFRCFISAEPPPLSYMQNIPESLLQSCISVANEAPADLKNNLLRAWKTFEDPNGAAMEAETKACLFSLCWYHAVVLGRRRFGQQGWSKRYSFNQGDLTVCSNILRRYIRDSSTIPWEDLRYIFGEIMYGGHITDAWDRRTNNTYLEWYLHEGIFEECELAPGFTVPPVNDMSFEQITEYISEKLPPETPPLFGLHPNAEIGYLSSYCDEIMTDMVMLSGLVGGQANAAADASDVKGETEKLLAKVPENFIMLDIDEKVQNLLGERHAPYALVAVQECARMNVLLDYVRSSLTDLVKALDGQLSMSEALEELLEALSVNQVPGRNPFHRITWEKLAWPSRKSLSSWLVDLQNRHNQLVSWTAKFEMPSSMWLPGLMNPTAFLTAVTQVVARDIELPLDSIVLDTHVTLMTEPSQATSYPERGMYVHGLYLEGARWYVPETDAQGYKIDDVLAGGNLAEARLKELHPPMPLLYLRPVQVQPGWIPSSVGYLRRDDSIYECPLYVTTFRGPTYVTLTTLRCLESPNRWTIAGVAMIMQLDD